MAGKPRFNSAAPWHVELQGPVSVLYWPFYVVLHACIRLIGSERKAAEFARLSPVTCLLGYWDRGQSGH
jgi:hypothetical protein